MAQRPKDLHRLERGFKLCWTDSARPTASSARLQGQAVHVSAFAKGTASSQAQSKDQSRLYIRANDNAHKVALIGTEGQCIQDDTPFNNHPLSDQDQLLERLSSAAVHDWDSVAHLHAFC